MRVGCVDSLSLPPEQLQQAVQQAATAARSGCTDASRDRNLGTTPARRERKPGGYATAWKTTVLRRQHGLDGLERCLQKLCVCLFCTFWLTLGSIGEISESDGKRDVDTS